MDVFEGTIDENGQIVINNHHWVKDLLLKKEGKEIQIQIKDADKRRSALQNRWYWGVAIKTVQEELIRLEGLDYSKEDIHHYILDNVVKTKFRTKTVMGVLITYSETRSTSAMSTKEFNNFKFELIVHFDRKGIAIPEPKKNNFTNDYEPNRKTS